MKTTLELLQAQYGRAAITADQLIADWFPQYSDQRGLLDAIRKHRITGLKLHTHNNSQRGPRYIYLTDLATWLDQHHNPAAQAA